MDKHQFICRAGLTGLIGFVLDLTEVQETECYRSTGTMRERTTLCSCSQGSPLVGSESLRFNDHKKRKREKGRREVGRCVISVKIRCQLLVKGITWDAAMLGLGVV